MKTSEYYIEDVLFFFNGRQRELALYQELVRQMDSLFPDMSVKVGKSQISFYNRHLFAAASIPLRRKKGWPKECLMVTLGLTRPLPPTIAAVSTEPYPGRWTNHILVENEGQIDIRLLSLLREAWDFSQNKR